MKAATEPRLPRGEARERLLRAALDLIRAQGFAGTSVDQLCHAAGVTKGAFFHHFPSKEALGVAAAEYWSQTTAAAFASASYHGHDDPLDRILAYVDLRRRFIAGDIAGFTCLAGTLAQEVYRAHPAIRQACAESIFGHAATLEPDLAAAMSARGVSGCSAASLAAHMQAVLQGAFILAKAADDPSAAVDSVDHLERYLLLLFQPSRGGRHELSQRRPD